MVNRKKLILGLVSLGTLIGSFLLSFGIVGHDLHSTHAQQASGVTLQEFYIPSSLDPWGTAFDSNGNAWLAIPGCDPSPTCNPNTPPGELAVFNPANSNWIKTYQLPSGYAQPLFLAFDAQGNVWFAMPMDNSIGMLNPAADTFQQWAVPTANAGPWDIVVDHNGKIWFTEHYTNKIGRFDPATHTFMEVATPASNSQPYGITVDASNNVWFAENNSSVALIGEYTSGGQLQEYKIRNTSSNGLTPHMITVDPNGNIWWTEGWTGMIGKLNVSQAVPGTNQGVTEYAYTPPCTTCGEHTSGISFDSNGLIWFDEEFANKLAKAVQTIAPTPTPTSGSSPTPTNTVLPSPTPTLSPTVSPTPGTTLAQDNFQRANQTHWGKASDGLTWGGDANSVNVFSISANTGQVANGSTNYSAVLGPVATNAEILFSGSISKFSNTNIGAVLRWTDGNNWYKAYIDGSNLIVQKKVKGSATILGKASFTAAAGTSYTLRFSVSGP